LSEERTSSKKPVLFAKLEEALDEVETIVWATCEWGSLGREKINVLMNRFSSFKSDTEKCEKALLFVEHIEKHLHQSDGFKYKLYGNPKVICKICGKTIDQIAEFEASS
jgi:hypothetical protein